MILKKVRAASEGNFDNQRRMIDDKPFGKQNTTKQKKTKTYNEHYQPVELVLEETHQNTWKIAVI